jgi:hypothetical protein
MIASNAVIVNLSFFGGDTPTLQFGPLLNSTGDPIDLTGAQVNFIVYNGSTPYSLVQIQKAIGSGVTLSPQSGDTVGVFQVSLLAGDTANLGGLYYYECIIVLAGVSLVSVYGYITITESRALPGSVPPPVFQSVLPVILTADTEIDYMAPPQNGVVLVVIVSQDSVGGHLMTWGALFLLAPNAIPSDPNTVNVFSFISSGGYWYLTGTPLLGATL